MSNSSRGARLTALAAISPAAALLGGLIDEQLRLGFTIWLGACRASGYSPSSVLSFTLQLLPNAVVGALLGGLLVQVVAFAARHHEGRVRECLAAHAGCVLVMPAALILCALAVPFGLTFVLEIALAALAAGWLLTSTDRRSTARVNLHQ
jgi:hypothetical protein